ncbi:beta/gamma crystallin domain-containing protein [Streptomyces capparidis]
MTFYTGTNYTGTAYTYNVGADLNLSTGLPGGRGGLNDKFYSVRVGRTARIQAWQVAQGTVTPIRSGPSTSRTSVVSGA